MHVRKLVSDKPLLIDDPAPDEIKSPVEWVMPEPVFRSSKGRTPKSGTAEAADDALDLMDTDPNMGSGIEPEEDISGEKTIEIVGGAKAKVQPKRGCLSKFLYLILGIVLLAAAAIFAIIYFFYYAVKSTDGLN